ncbi:MAG: hypothetical protein KatS3mg090_0691 [Patescibacteria group bacterium]|nr:MAG: hypothetical protein KatS3mg090_0691 [Patescibacteria group bacterium]
MRRFFQHLKFSFKNSFLTLVLVILVLPSSTNYKLKSFDFGTGGQGDMSSTNFSMEGLAGGFADELNSSSFGLNAGLIFVQSADVPPAPVLQNSSNWYNKLLLIVNPGDNPSSATFAVAISDDNWATTKWVQSDNTVGTTLGIEDFQTYAEWGGSSGSYIVGLEPNTTYKVKVKARQGNYTESSLGPEAVANTVNVSLSFDIDVSSNDQETSSPYTVDLGELSFGSVISANDKIWLDFETNAENGGAVYVYDQYAGIRSFSVNYVISSTTGDLSSLSEGYGLQVLSTTQSSGAILSSASPYDGSNNVVGQVDNILREILTANGPIFSGRGSVGVKVKISSETPSAYDYEDVLTFVAVSNF